MDFRNILQSLNSLSEGETKETDKGRTHKGEYGNKYGKEDVRDQYGHKIGRKDKDEKTKKDEPKRGRGRPTKGDKDEHGNDTKFDTSGLQGMLGKKPSKEVGKTSKKHSLKEYIEEVENTQQLNEAEALVKNMINTPDDRFASSAQPGWKTDGVTKLGTLYNGAPKEIFAGEQKGMWEIEHDDDYPRGPWQTVWVTDPKYFDTFLSIAYKDDPNQKIYVYGRGLNLKEQGVAEAEQVTIAPAQQNTQVIKQGDKVLGSVTNPQLAAQIKSAIGQGQMSLASGSKEEMTEEGEEKWIQKAIKHPGALTRKAKAAGQSTSAFAKAHAHDSGTTGKQARLAQTLAKMHESLQAQGVVLTEGEMKNTMLKFFDELELGPKGYNIKPAMELHDKGLATAVINKTLAHGRFKGMSGTFKDQLRDAALEHFGFTNFEESLEEADLVPHPSKDMSSKDMFRQHAVQGGKDLKVGDPSAFTPSRIQTPNRPVEEPTPWKVDPINAATDRAFNFISGLGKSKSKLESTEMKDVQLESWEKELNNLLNEGITVSTSTGQQGAPDSVSINATDNDANELLNILRQSGMGVFGGNDKPAMTPYGVVSQGEEEPTGTGTEPETSPEVVGDGDDMLSLIKKMTGLSAGPVGQEPEGTASSDYEDEEACDDCGQSPCACDHEEGEEGEEEVDEGNKYAHNVLKAKEKGLTQADLDGDGDMEPVKEEEVEEGNKYLYNVLKAKAAGKKKADLDGDGKMDKVKEGHESCNECGYPMESCECEEQVEEGFSNDAGGDAMGDTELMQLKELLSMGGDLHKMKRDQTVLNPTQVSMAESLAQWKKLSGIK